MKLKIKNPRLVALLLVNSIFLTTTGCENEKSRERIETTAKLVEWENENTKQKESVKLKTQKVNHNICLKKGKVTIKEKPKKESRVLKK